MNRFEIEGGQISNTGDYSVFLSGANSSVFGVEMFGNGCGGINVTGGDQVLMRFCLRFCIKVPC